MKNTEIKVRLQKILLRNEQRKVNKLIPNDILDLKDIIKRLTIPSVVSSAWYCKISTAKGQWFEIVTGKNETDVSVKITEKFGKETIYNLIDRYEII